MNFDDEGLQNAIKSLVPDADFSVNRSGELAWSDPRDKPSDAEIIAEAQRLQASSSAQAKLRRIAARRYEAETAGTTMDGIAFDTDRQSQALITGAALSATRNPDYTVKWKTQAGPVTLDADQLGAAADAVRDHVQACFDREFELLDAVADGTFKESMLEEGWPE